MRTHFMAEIQRHGFDSVLERAVNEALDDADHLFISVDIDVVDPSAAPGTGSPEPGGLSSHEILRGATPGCRGRDRRYGRCRGQPSLRRRQQHHLPSAHRCVLEGLTGVAMRRLGLTEPDYLEERAANGPTRAPGDVRRAVRDDEPNWAPFLSSAATTSHSPFSASGSHRRGQTVLGYDFDIGPGGKGTNQAIAAKRLGADVDFVVKVGADDFGAAARERFALEGLPSTGILRGDGHTGVALIMVDSARRQCDLGRPGRQFRTCGRRPAPSSAASFEGHARVVPTRVHGRAVR